MLLVGHILMPILWAKFLGPCQRLGKQRWRQSEKDLTKLPLEELIGSLITHEITMEKQELEEKPKKNLAFKIVHHVDSDDDDEEEEEVEEDIALIIRKFWNLLRNK